MTKEELAKSYANEFNKEYQQIAYDAFLCGYGAKCDTIVPEGLEKEIESWIPNHIKCERAPDTRKAIIEWAGFIARHFAEWGAKNAKQ